MSLADIKAKIEADAKAEADDIIGRFKEQAEDTSKAVKAEIEKLRVIAEKKIEIEKTEILRRRKIVANLDVGKIELGAKRSLIEKTFAEALDNLSKTPGEKYLSFMTDLLDRSISSGDETIYLGKGEKNLDQKWIDSYNDKKKTDLTLSPDMVSGSGGFVARKGDIYVNCTWEALLRGVREDLEPEVVNRLFSN